MFVIIFEPFCNISPETFKPVYNLVPFLSLKTKAQPIIVLRAVMMYIDHYIHIQRYCIIHHFLHAADPNIINFIVRRITDHVAPGNRNTHTIKTLIVYRFQNSFGCNGRIPCRFTGDHIIVPFQSISEIPACTHFVHDFIRRKLTEFALRRYFYLRRRFGI